MLHAVAPLPVSPLNRQSDLELLRRYADTKEQHAFTTLVKRYTNLVLSVCRRASVPAAEVEDVCQAVFLLLSTKVQSVVWKPSIANWLYATARHLAAKASRQHQRRARREKVAAQSASVSMVDEMTVRELFAILDEEVARLPAHYREPIVLTYFNDVGRQEAAVRLGIPRATVKIRLERARQRLSLALQKRGVTAGISSIVLASSATSMANAMHVNAVLTAVGGSPSQLARQLAQGVAMPSFGAIFLATMIMAMACMAGLRLMALSPMPAMALESSGLCILPRQEPPDPAPQLGDGVRTTAFSPDGKYLAVSTRQLEKTSDGKLIVSTRTPNPGTNPTISLYDTSTWKIVSQWKTGQTTTSLCFAADGKSLFSAEMDSKIYEWDVPTGKSIRTLEVDKGKCVKLTLAANGKMLLGAYESALAARLPDGSFLHDQSDNYIALWDLKTSQVLRSFAYDGAALLPSSVALSRDGSVLAASYHSSETASADARGFHGIIEWDVNSGKELRRYALPRSNKASMPLALSIVFTLDDKQIVVVGGESIPTEKRQRIVGKVWLLDCKTGSLVKLLGEDRHGVLRSIALSNDGTRLYVSAGWSAVATTENKASFSPEIHCWDTVAWKSLWVHQDAQMTTETQVMPVPGNKRVGIAGEHGLKFLDALQGKPRGALINANESK